MVIHSTVVFFDRASSAGYHTASAPASEVRDNIAALSDANFGSKGHWQVYDSSAAFDLKFLKVIAANGAGTSNRRH
jgi:hypothetical protein